MKCGIITYHFASNYGAMLQCYALYKALQKMGNDVQVINYISDMQWDNNSLYRKKQGIKGYIKNVVLLPFHFVRVSRATKNECFRKKELRCGNRIKSIEQLREHIAEEQYNVLIAGSDQVWNPRIFDFNEAFFLPIETKCKKVGYAVSVGDANKSDLDKYSKWIKMFDEITVRESKSVDLLKYYTKTKMHEVVDPVFLLEQEEWEEKVKEINVSETNDYLLCYFVKTSNIKRKLEIAHRIARERKLKIVILNPKITKYNLYKNVISNAGATEFLAYFQSATYVCTDSFHGTAFSLIFQRQFITLESNKNSGDDRKRNLLEKVSLQKRIMYISDEYQAMADFDYVEVKKKLEQLRKKSYDVLKTFLC